MNKEEFLENSDLFCWTIFTLVHCSEPKIQMCIYIKMIWFYIFGPHIHKLYICICKLILPIVPPAYSIVEVIYHEYFTYNVSILSIYHIFHITFFSCCRCGFLHLLDSVSQVGSCFRFYLIGTRSFYKTDVVVFGKWFLWIPFSWCWIPFSWWFLFDIIILTPILPD